MPTVPRLSTTLTGPIGPADCRSCGASADAAGAVTLDRWLEADDADRFNDRSPVVVLCRPCSNRLIEPHPRLYHRMPPTWPRAGSMSICLDCKHLSGVSCLHPRAKANGGPGVQLTIRQPVSCFVDYRGKRGERRGRQETHYPEAARACAQHEARPAPRSQNPEPGIDEPSPVG